MGGAVVSGSFQMFDQTYLVDALGKLGPRYVGVTQLPATVTDDELMRLDAAGVRAVRFNVKRGGSADVQDLASMAHAFMTSRAGTLSSTSIRRISTRFSIR